MIQTTPGLLTLKPAAKPAATSPTGTTCFDQTLVAAQDQLSHESLGEPEVTDVPVPSTGLDPAPQPPAHHHTVPQQVIPNEILGTGQTDAVDPVAGDPVPSASQDTNQDQSQPADQGLDAMVAQPPVVLAPVDHETLPQPLGNPGAVRPVQGAPILPTSPADLAPQPPTVSHTAGAPPGAGQTAELLPVATTVTTTASTGLTEHTPTAPTGSTPGFDTPGAAPQPVTPAVAEHTPTNVTAPAPMPTPTPAVSQTSGPPQQTPAPPLPLVDQVRGPLGQLRAAPQGEHVFSIRITPENLGPVQVRAHIGPENIRVELVGASDSVRDQLRTMIGDLRRDLQSTGLSAQLNVSSTDTPTGQSQNSGPDFGRGQQSRNNRPQAPANGQAEPEAGPDQTANIIPSTGARSVDFLA